MKLPIKAGEDFSRILPGPVLLLAGPGTGKTHQLARRVRWLVQEQNVPPEQLTVITFSDEAARNMRERLSDRDKKDVYLPSRDQPSRICTIHSLAYEVVRKHCDLLGFSEVPTLVPDYLVGILLEDAAQLVGLPRRAGKQAGVCRDKGLCQRSPERDECRICDRYCRILRSHNRVDYSDQMLLACKILRDPEHPDIKQSYQAGALYLLVDEYQDINAGQFEFIRHLVGDNAEGLYAVGDDNQSIYAFRGATPEYIRRFDQDWPRAQVMPLPESRRCPQAILDAAAAVVTRGSPGSLCDPSIHSSSEVQDKVTIRRVPSEVWEASDIAHKIAGERGARDALVLIPAWRYAPPIKRALRSRRVPYECRTQVHRTGLHVLSELARWLSDGDDFAFRSCLQYIVSNRSLESLGRPKTGIRRWEEDILGRVSQLWDIADQQGGSLFGALNGSARGTELAPVSASVEELHVAANGQPHDLLAAAGRVLGPWGDTPSLMAEATEWVDDCRSRNRAAGRPAARVLSMWQAKGLEADLVFIVGLEEGAFPDERNAETSLEEQYRMLYVAMTRAKQKLYLYYAQKRSGERSYRGSRGGYTPPQPAQCLCWLPDDAVDREPLWARKSRGPKRRPASAGK